MGQALYRKYRSKSLKEIVGQEHITDTLAEAIKSGRISHAYLFTGPRGVGKTSIARILAHEINQLPYDEKQAHIDIIEIDAASNRRIDEIRELRDKIHVAPASAKYKVYIIDEVHMLTREAFNALLKTLEEPPEHAIFILATTEAHKLPETIVSRTQRYTFRPIEPAKAAAHLKDIAGKEKISISDDAIELIVEHGNGSFRDSISLLDQLSSRGKKIDLHMVQQTLGIAPPDAISNMLDAIRSGMPTSQVYQQLSELFDLGYQPANIAKQMARTLRQQLVHGATTTVNDTALLAVLLEVPLSHDPEAQLEIAILSYHAVTPAVQQPPQVVTSQPTPTTAKPAAKPKAAPVEQPVSQEPVADEPEPVPEMPEQPADSTAQASEKTASTAPVVDAEVWQELLNVLKKQYNTLYGIVRMAQPDFSSPGTLQLTFGFAFHQKRANEAKNRQIIHDALAAVTGQTMEVRCEYSSEAKPGKPVLAAASATTAAETISQEANPLSTISNIFGGVEVVE